MAALFVASVVPLFAVAVYARPFGDDFAFGAELRELLRDGGGPLSPLTAGISNVRRFYGGWQGTFSAVFLMSLNPGICDARFYFFTTPIMLAALIFPALYLARAVFSWRDTLLIGLPVLWLAIQFAPDAREAFFWYNGAVMYSFFFGATVLWLRLAADIFAGGARASKVAACGALGVFIGGGNYVSALTTVLLAGILLCLAYKKPRGVKISLLAMFALSAASLVISAMAPGNAARALNRVDEPQMEFFATILASFVQAASDIAHWTNWQTVLILCALVPVFAAAARRTDCNFRYPLAVLAISFCLLAAHNAPHFFATSWAGPGRLRNIVYFAYVLLAAGNVFYMTGYFAPRLAGFFEKIGRKKHAAIVAAFLVVAIFSGGTTARLCMYDLQSGLARRFAAEMDGRIAYLEARVGEDVVLPPLSAKTDEVPRILSVPRSDLAADAEFWANVAWARYFGNRSVVVIR